MSVQPPDCVCHRRIVGCVNDMLVVEAAAASFSNAQSDLLKSFEIRVCLLVCHVIRRKMQGVGPESVNTFIQVTGACAGNFWWGCSQKVVESSVDVECEKLGSLM